MSASKLPTPLTSGADAYQNPAYTHKDWLAGKVGRIALAKKVSSAKDIVLKIFDDVSAFKSELEVLQFLCGSSAKAHVVEVVDAHDGDISGGDTRSCLVLEVPVTHFMLLTVCTLHRDKEVPCFTFPVDVWQKLIRACA